MALVLLAEQFPLFAALAELDCAGSGAALRGKVRMDTVMAIARHSELASKEAISLVRDIGTSFSMRATRSTS
jgi:hypothetical protein